MIENLYYKEQFVTFQKKIEHQLAQKMFSRVEETLKRYVADYYDHPGILFLMGKLCVEKGYIADAKAYLERSFKKGTDVPEFLALYGSVLVDNGDLDEAETILGLAIKMDPTLPDTLLAISKYALKKELYMEAISFADLVLQQNSELLEAKKIKVLCYFKTDKKANEILPLVNQIQQEDVDFQYANYLVAKRQYDECKKFIKKFMLKNPNSMYISQFQQLVRRIKDAESALEDLPSTTKKQSFQIEETDDPGLNKLIKELNSYIGMDSVKQKVQELINFVRLSRYKKEVGIHTSDPVAPHIVFTGNPGTGKTTVARLIGSIFYKMGLLKKNKLVEVKREDLIGQYIGDTEANTKAKVNKALGGVLFIDEAYALVGEGRDYGPRALTVILTAMENNRGNLLVIAAGYEEEMEHFLKSNPGLRTRFTEHIHFDDYTPEELLEIYKKMSIESNYKTDPKALKKLYEEFVRVYRKRDATFGNARLVRNYLSRILQAHTTRLARHSRDEWANLNLLTTITVKDIEAVLPKETTHEIDIPINEEILEKRLKELNSLIGLQSVKEEIDELIQLVRYYKREGRNTKQLLGHTLLIGNPGTGKTEVARILAGIYEALGILKRGDLIEVDREKLVSENIGGTEAKTTQAIEQAMGGTLFIDEAYTLVKNSEEDHGITAVEILLKKMSDHKGEFMVLAAGYPDDMQEFLNSNPGLTRRFERTITFEDYTPDELLYITKSSLRKKDFHIMMEAEDLLKETYITMYRKRDRNFGNAGIAVRFATELMKKVDLQNAVDERPDELRTVITVDDVEVLLPKNKTTIFDVPIDEKQLHEKLLELYSLVGLSSVKREVQQLADLVRYYKEEGKPVHQLLSHMLLIGNPGTGKTVVGRILAGIYEALGVLERGELVEVDRSGLVDKFRGGTEEKTTTQIDKAMGGILFIDEAYTLTKNKDSGDPGYTAVEVLLKRMSDDQGKFLVMAAGYPDDMEDFLESNAGLPRRFGLTLYFEDYTPNELLEITTMYVEKQGYTLSDAAIASLTNHYDSIYATRNKTFGNAGLAKKIVNEAIKNLDYRNAQIPFEDRALKRKQIIEEHDIEYLTS